MRIMMLDAEAEHAYYEATLITGCWFLYPGVQAITLGKHLVLTRKELPDSLVLAHEIVHLEQFHRYRLFILRYVWEYLKHGRGMKNKYEREAYERQADVREHTNIMVTP